MEELILGDRARQAEAYFKDGYNCSQSVVLAFADCIEVDREILLKMSSPFGGGMGRLREVCGSVSGMFQVLGYFEGCDSARDRQQKIELYKDVQKLAAQFQEINGSYICRELLSGVKHTAGQIPEERTESYYKKRPCGQLVAISAQLIENHLKEKGFI